MSAIYLIHLKKLGEKNIQYNYGDLIDFFKFTEVYNKASTNLDIHWSSDLKTLQILPQIQISCRWMDQHLSNLQ